MSARAGRKFFPKFQKENCTGRTVQFKVARVEALFGLPWGFIRYHYYYYNTIIYYFVRLFYFDSFEF